MSLDDTRSAYVALVAASLSWGVSTATSKLALADVTAFDLLLVEITVATAALWCLQPARSHARRDFRAAYLLLGLLEPAGAYALFDLGLERTSASHGALLVSLEALVVAALAAALLRERPGRPLVAALALGVVGAALLARHETHDGGSLHGDLLVLGAVVAAGLHSIATRRLAPRASAVALTGYQLLGASLAAVPIWLVVTVTSGSQLTHAPSGAWIAAVATGLLGSALPLLLFSFALARLPATRAAPVVNLVPLFGVAASVALLGERLTAPQLLAGLLILVAVGAAQLGGEVRR